MSATVNLRFELQGTVLETTFTAGDRNEALPLTLSGDILSDLTYPVLTTEIRTVFINSGFPTTFSAILVIADGADVFVEEVCDENGTTNARPFARKLRPDWPYIIPTNVAKSAYVVNFAGGANDTIDIVRVKNENAATRNVRVIVLK